MSLANMSPAQRQYLQRKGIDLVTYFFRAQVLSQLRQYFERYVLSCRR